MRADPRGDQSDEGEEHEEVDRARRVIGEAAALPGREHASPHDAARQALLALRERDGIGDEVLIRMLRETDLHARASEENVMPGAGPPNP